MANNDIFVTGPTNVVRLVGEVGGRKKVLYVFFDFHVPCTSQVPCDDVFAVPISLYLAKEFKKLDDADTKYDLFMETFPIGFTEAGRGPKFLHEMRYFVAKSISYDKERDVVTSGLFKNVRMHYIDVRDYLVWDLLWNQMDDLRNSYQNFADTYTNLDIVKQQIEHISKGIASLNKIIFGNQQGGKKTKIIQPYVAIDADTQRINFDRLMDKILVKYHHPEIKKVIPSLFDTFFRPQITGVMKKFKNINTRIQELEGLLKINNLNTDWLFFRDDQVPYISKFPLYDRPNDAIGNLNNQNINDIDRMILMSKDASCIVMDTYFIRRFLDKDYITNGISYTGAGHSMNYITILCKYFNFSITHTSFARDDIETLNDKVKNMEIGTELYKLFLPDDFYQCSNLKGFPKNFL